LFVARVAAKDGIRGVFFRRSTARHDGEEDNVNIIDGDATVDECG